MYLMNRIKFFVLTIADLKSQRINHFTVKTPVNYTLPL